MAETYILLYEQVCSLVLTAGPTFRIDMAWSSYVMDTLVDKPQFWTPNGLALFDGDELAICSFKSLVSAIRATLGAAGGPAFFASYLEQVGVGEAKWKGLRTARAALRAVLQQHKANGVEFAAVLMKLAVLEQEGATVRVAVQTDGANEALEAAALARCFECKEVLRVAGASLEDVYRCAGLLMDLCRREEPNIEALLSMWSVQGHVPSGNAGALTC